MTPKNGPKKDLAGKQHEGVLLPYQKAWLEDKSPVKVAEKSRQVGFSWSEAADCALYAASAEGKDVWYVGYNRDMAEEFIQDCGKWSRYYNLAASAMEEFLYEDEDKAILSFRIKFASGHRITALSSKPSNMRGKRGRAVIDEAAFHDDLKKLIKAAMALLIWGGDVRIFSSHNGANSEFNELIEDVRKGKLDYSLHRIAFREAVEQGLCKRIFTVLGRDWSAQAEKEYVDKMYAAYGDDAEEELNCVPSQGSGVYFSRALIEARMSGDLPVLFWKCDDRFTFLPELMREAECRDFCEAQLKPLLEKLDVNLRHFFGVDFARSTNLSVFAPLTQKANLDRRFPFLLELENVPFDQQKQIAFYICDRLPRFSGGAFDARGNGQYLAETAAQRYGENRILQAMLSESFYRDAFPKYKAAFEDGTIELPMSSDVIDDHRAVKQVKGVPKLPDGKINKGTRGEQRHGDSAIACMLAHYASENIEAGEIEFQSTGVRRATIAGVEGF